MKTTIIPAQITTVEDKIAGSLNMTQILILMFPVLWTALIYILLPVPMKLSSYKVGLIVACVFVCILLAIRIKEKIIAEWLGIILKYRFRPKYWLFDKNDLTSRQLDIPDIPNIAVSTRKKTARSIHTHTPDVAISDLVKVQNLIDTGKVAVRYQFEKKNL